MPLRPVAVEPTADGVAVVASVFVSLPGKSRGPVSLAIGSTLTLASRQLVATNQQQGRALRRRGSHAVHRQDGGGGGVGGGAGAIGMQAL